MTQIRTNVSMRTIYLIIAIVGLSFAAVVQGADEVVSIDGQFGSFISLGTTGDEMNALGPDRVESAAVEEQRTPSFWHYFTNRGIRVRTCADDGLVATVNAMVTPVTARYVTEAGVRIGDSLERVSAAYGDQLQPMPESEGTIWFINDDSTNNRLTFGFSSAGDMRWVALGALRENGWTCGRQED
jgi:hypothetical protein